MTTDTITGLYIVDKYMVVHKSVGVDELAGCTETATRTRYPVTLNQCLVYHLPSCTQCWPDTRLFFRAIGRGSDG